MPVNKERVRLLVDALRSGEYEQGGGSLRPVADKYCCVGVGCDVARKNGIGIRWVPIGSDSATAFDGSSTVFTPRLMEWYGFEPRYVGDGDPVLVDSNSGKHITMIGANDADRWTFAEIADALEKRYLSEEGQE